MNIDVETNRREFLKTAGIATASLVIGLRVPAKAKEAVAGGKPLLHHYFVIGATPGDFTFVMDKAEMGQGVITGQVTLFCEELDLNPALVKVVPAPVKPIYGTLGGMQLTGGSTSTPDRWLTLRQAGANVRAGLVASASTQLQTPATDLMVKDGFVQVKGDPSKRVSFSELAVGLTVNEEEPAPLKDAKDFQYIGKSVSKVDALDKSTGRARFGIDFQTEGLLTAVILRPPTFGGKATSFDGSKALTQPGIKHVVQISHGIAIVGEKYWQVRGAKSLVSVQWDKGANAGLSSEKIQKDYDQLLKRSKGKEAHAVGDVDKVFAETSKEDLVEAIYELPYLAHATMEPMNASAHVQKDRVDVWVGTQGPTLVQNAVADFVGLSRDQVFVHNEKYLGGGFGRRSTLEYPMEAVELSAKINAPVKVIWSREDDTKFSPMRPINRHQFKAAVKNGKVLAYEHRIGCESIMQNFMPEATPQMLPGWIPGFLREGIGSAAKGMMGALDFHMVTAEGAAHEYDMPNQFVGISSLGLDIPIHFWRAVGHSYNGFVKEGFIDELATKAADDPYLFRQKLLSKNPRALATLDKVAEMSNWRKAPAEGISRGIAQHFSFGTYVSQVAEVRVTGNSFTVEKMYCAVDCGVAINPDVIKDQMKSGIIYGLSAALGATLGLEDGGVVQSNFHDYAVMRINQAPEIEVEIIESSESPMGVGEPGLPPAAPAVSNALYAATGKRLRTMPFQLS